jgi:ATP-dependent protease ClpP protease subunit
MIKDKRFSARYREILNAAPREGLIFRAAKDDAPAELLIYDQIGASFWEDGVMAKDVIAALAKADGKPIVARINSPGGDVFEGFAIYNALIAYKGGLTTVVDGIAASAASWIALAGSKMSMNAASMFMIHDSSVMAYGNKADLTALAGIMAKLDGQFAEIYAAKTGMSIDDVAAAMSAETYYTAAEAEAAGFADEVIPAPSAKAKNDAVLPIENVAPTAPTATADKSTHDLRMRRLRLAESF